MFKSYFLIFVYIYSSILYGQKNVETHTLYIKFDQVLILEELEDVFKIEGFNKLSIEYPFTVKKALHSQRKKLTNFLQGINQLKIFSKLKPN